jgi:osmotically-inducible protein OsmY
MELVWGSVYAMAKERILHVQVQMDGKSDAEVADEIRAQLAQQGWTPGEVVVERGPGGSSVSMGANDGEGRQLQIVQKKDGAGANQVQIQVDPIDDTRDPGMTDDELRAKILAQLKARGMDAEVVVQGDHIEIRADKRVEKAP